MSSVSMPRRPLPHPTPSQQLGLRDQRIARTFDEVAQDGRIDLDEASSLLAAGLDGVGYTRPEVADLRRIANHGKRWFGAATWGDRASFDSLVEATLKSGNLQSADGAVLAAAIEAIPVNDTDAMAHACRALYKMRSNVVFASEAAKAVEDAIYNKLTAMDQASASWPSRAVFDDAVATLLECGTPIPGQADPAQAMVFAIGAIESSSQLTHALRAYEKLRANGFKSELVDGALYAKLQQFDHAAVDSTGTAFDYYVNGVRGIEALPQLDFITVAVSGLRLQTGAVDALLVSGRADDSTQPETVIFGLTLPWVEKALSISVARGVGTSEVIQQLNAQLRELGLRAYSDGQDHRGRDVVRIRPAIRLYR